MVKTGKNAIVKTLVVRREQSEQFSCQKNANYNATFCKHFTHSKRRLKRSHWAIEKVKWHFFKKWREKTPAENRSWLTENA